MKKLILSAILFVFLFACKKEASTSVTEINDATENLDSVINDVVEKPIKKSIKLLKEELNAKGFQTYDYVNETTHDTILLQQYFMAFLKTGPIRGQNEEEAAELQKEHLAHLSKMYELGLADISGPFGDNGSIRGITIYNVPTLKMADSLANSDPMVKAGRLEIEIHPWWAAKGYPLR